MNVIEVTLAYDGGPRCVREREGNEEQSLRLEEESTTAQGRHSFLSALRYVAYRGAGACSRRSSRGKKRCDDGVHRPQETVTGGSVVQNSASVAILFFVWLKSAAARLKLLRLARKAKDVSRTADGDRQWHAVRSHAVAQLEYCWQIHIRGRHRVVEPNRHRSVLIKLETIQTSTRQLTLVPSTRGRPSNEAAGQRPHCSRR